MGPTESGMCILDTSVKMSRAVLEIPENITCLTIGRLERTAETALTPHDSELSSSDWVCVWGYVFVCVHVSMCGWICVCVCAGVYDECVGTYLCACMHL